MNFVKKMVVLCLVAIGVVSSVSLTTPVGAAPIDDVTGSNFINGAYGSDYVEPGNSTRFVFINPFTVRDTVTQILYKTKATACDNDKMFHCDDGQAPVIQDKFFWYWPEGNTLPIKDKKCPAAIRLNPNSDGNTPKSELELIRPSLDALEQKCIIKNGGGGATATKNVEGDGDDDRSIQADQILKLGVTKENLSALATTFHWVNSSQIKVYGGRSQALNKLDPTLDAHKKLVDELKKKGSTNKYGSGYDFYVNQSCLNTGNGNIKAFVAVLTAGGHSLVDIIHSEDGGNSGKNYSAYWDGDGQECLMENSDNSPNTMWGGKDRQNDAVIGIANVSNYTNPESVPSGGGGGKGSSVGDETGDRAGCDASKQPLTWIVCPVVDGLAGLSDAIIKNFVVPFLRSKPIETNDPNSSLLKAWQAFRVLANIILVIAIIVIVFGQAIGGGLVDAYTAKKALPRLLIAAILVNVSIYIVAALTDVTNILGQGLAQLITGPFKVSDSLQFTPNFGATAGAGAGIAAFVGALIFVEGFLSLLLLFVLLPAVVAMIGVFVTLIVRQGILLFLVIVSPVAFALYALPNTEQYFKKWWSLLIKTLLVYPIVMVVIAVANVLAALTANAQDKALINSLAGIVALVIYIIPLFLIPFAFKIAGGVVATLLTTVAGIGKRGEGFLKGNPNDPNSLQNRTKSRAGTSLTQRRGAGYNRINSWASRGAKLNDDGTVNKEFGRTNRYIRGKAGRFGASAVGGYGIEDKMSELRAKRDDIANKRINSGDDTPERAFLTDKDLFKAGKQGVGALQSAGYSEGLDYKFGDNGEIRLRNSQGKFHELAAVENAYKMYDSDQPGQQKSISYGYQKALLQSENDELLDSMPKLQKDLGLNDSAMNNNMIGAGFQQQGKSKQYKRYSVKEGQLNLDGSGLVDEMHAGVGTYAGLQQDADTWTTMTATYEAAQKEASTNGAAADSIIKMKEIAKQYQGMDQSQIEQQIRQVQPDMTQGASAAAAANIKEFVKMAGSGERTEGGSVTTRRRNEKINFKPPPESVGPPTNP